MSGKPKLNNSPGPWFKVRADRYLSDFDLRACSPGARALYIDLQCLMHRNKKYGFLIQNGDSKTEVKLQKALRYSPKKYKKWLSELIDAGKIERDADGNLSCPELIKEKEFRDKCRAAGKTAHEGKGDTEPPGETPGGDPQGIPQGETPTHSPGARIENRDPRSQNEIDNIDNKVTKKRRKLDRPTLGNPDIEGRWWQLQEKFDFPDSERDAITYLIRWYAAKAINEAEAALIDRRGNGNDPLKNEVAYFVKCVKNELVDAQKAAV